MRRNVELQIFRAHLSFQACWDAERHGHDVSGAQELVVRRHTGSRSRLCGVKEDILYVRLLQAALRCEEFEAVALVRQVRCSDHYGAIVAEACRRRVLAQQD